MERLHTDTFFCFDFPLILYVHVFDIYTVYFGINLGECGQQVLVENGVTCVGT